MLSGEATPPVVALETGRYRGTAKKCHGMSIIVAESIRPEEVQEANPSRRSRMRHSQHALCQKYGPLYAPHIVCRPVAETPVRCRHHQRSVFHLVGEHGGEPYIASATSSSGTVSEASQP